jgi:Holliday junction resolvasome RuvABC DNA-binding subunit
VIFFAYAFVAVIFAVTLRETADSRRRKRSRHTRGRVAQREVVSGTTAASRTPRLPFKESATTPAKDQTHKDVVSSLENLGFKRKQAEAAAMQTAGTFDEMLRASLLILKAAKQ